MYSETLVLAAVGIGPTGNYMVITSHSLPTLMNTKVLTISPSIPAGGDYGSHEGGIVQGATCARLPRLAIRLDLQGLPKYHSLSKNDPSTQFPYIR